MSIRKIRVLNIIHSLVSGGAEKQLRLLAAGLDANRYQVSIFCVNDEGHDLDSERVNIIKSSTQKLFSIRFFKDLYSAIKKDCPDVIHVWLPASVSIPALFFGRVLGKKVIFSFRNKMHFHRFLSYPEFLSALLFADKVVSNHEIIDSNKIFKFLYRIKSGEVIHNAVLIPEISSSSDRSLSPGENMVFVGRLTEQKNPLRLVKALSQIDEKLNWHLNMFGQGELHDEIKRLIADRGLEDKVTLRGFSSDIYSELGKATALIFPSVKEGMPNVLVEALALGVPCLVSNIAGNQSVVGSDYLDAVVWFEPDDDNDICEKITRFLENGYPVDVMVEKGKQLASGFTLDKMVKSYERCYSSLVRMAV